MENIKREEDLKNEIGNLKKELELVKKKSEEYLNGWKRAKADYLNFKKETGKKNQELIQFANVALISQLLPIFDSFKLALTHIPKDLENSDWVLGIINIKKQLKEFFERLGIEEIRTVGQKFDPNFHEAIVHEKKEGFKTDVIFEEVAAGYTLDGEVIKPAKVKVTK